MTIFFRTRRLVLALVAGILAVSVASIAVAGVLGRTPDTQISPRPNQVGGVTVSGVVLLQGNISPAGLVTVTLQPGDMTAATTEGGAWSVEGVPAGTYDVIAAASGYLSSMYAGLVVGTSDVAMEVTRLYAGDINADEVVNINDISYVTSNFPKIGPQRWSPGAPDVPTATPRPTQTPVIHTVVVTATSTAIPTVPGIVQIPAPDPKSPVGTAIFVTDTDILDQNGRNESQSPEFIHYWGMGETMFLRGPNDEALPWLASGWTLELAAAPSTKHVATLTIQQGVKFQNVPGVANPSGNWGEITADDIVWSMNDVNAITNPRSIHGQAGDFKIWGAWSKVDDYTVTFTFNAFDGTWKDDYLNQSGQSFVPFSKKAFDQEGATWVRDHVVATGPFQVESWTRSDKLLMRSRYAGDQQHWKPELTPKTARIQVIYAPDSTTRVAMMKTGEADVTNLAPKDVPQFVKTAGHFATTTGGGTMQMGIFFSGNLWELTSAVDGSPLTRGTYNVDFATIGNPTTTTDLGDMEEARLIRTALAMAYDRDAINKAILSGLGHAAHVEYVSIKNTRYQKDPLLGWETFPGSGITNVDNLKWGYKYDVAAARALITGPNVQGNYIKDSAPQNGPLGNRAFEISLYAQQPSEVRSQVQDAVVGYWTELGLRVFALKYSYQTFRPTIVGRTAVYPWITECDKGNEGNPWHFPKGLVQTSLTRGGFGCGFEIPFVLDNYRKVSNEPTTATAAALVDAYVQYMYDQALQPGIVSAPNLNVFNLKKIKAWPMPMSATSGQDGFWDLELQPGK